MYISYLLIIIDYFRCLNKRVFTFEWGIPLIITIGAYTSLYKYFTEFPFASYVDKILGLEGVLVGFSITSITFLTAGSNAGIEKLKGKMMGVFIGKREFSLFDMMLINFSFSLIFEIVIILITLLSPMLIPTLNILNFTSKAGYFSVFLFFVIQNLFLNIRNISEVYFALIRK